MKNVHIALVGDQTTPILTVFRELGGDELVLVHSADTSARADFIIDEVLRMPGYEYTLCSTECVDAYDLDDIFTLFSRLANEDYADCHLTVNISGGTKQWAICAYDVFAEAGAEIYYIDKTCDLWSLTEKRKVAESVEWFQPSHLRQECVRFSDFTLEDDQMANIIEEVFSRYQDDYRSLANNSGFPSSLPPLKKFWEKESSVSPSSVKWNNGSNSFDLDIAVSDSDIVSYSLSSPHICNLFLNYGWFEYKVAKLVSKWPLATDVTLQNKFSSSNDFDRPDFEIDIMFKADGRQFCIEVKTSCGKPSALRNFNTSGRHQSIGGDGNVLLFVSLSRVFGATRTVCEDYSIPYFAFNDYPDEELEPAFFDFLESHLRS